MNRQIVQLFTLLAVLFGILIFATSWWTVWGRDGLEDNTANRRPILEDLRVPRGDILAEDGTVLAHSNAQGSGEQKIYVRDYPEGSLFAHAIGYSFIDQRVGLEESLHSFPTRRSPI